jgi:hypothetical protein
MAIIKIRNAAIDLDAAEIPNLPASKITSGTLDNARISLDAAEIPNLDTAKITTGQFADARIADLDATKLTGTITPSDNTISLAKLTASGTKDATTFLRGDNTFAEPGGGDFVKLANSTASSVSSLSFEDTFTDDYQYYKIFIKDLYFTNADIPVFNYLTSGSTAVTTGYFTISNYSYAATGSSTGGQSWRHWNGDDHGLAVTNTGTSADNPMWCELTLLNPRSTTKRRLSICLSGMYGNDSQFYSESIRNFNTNTGTAFGGIKIQGNGSQTIGNITATVYGIK